MKISYRTHPILEYLESDTPDIKGFEIDRAKLDAIFPYLDNFWTENRMLFKENIYYVSEPFAEACAASIDKLFAAGLFKELGNISGTLLIKSASICYKAERIFVAEKNDWGYKIHLIWFRGREIQVFSTDGAMFVSKVYRGKEEADYSDMQIVKNIFQFAESMELFKKHAEVETVYLPAGQRIRSIDCKYVNETKSNITTLDSKWFTTLVKSDGFKVRGHFRLQPKKKDGQWTKELIWINDFEKTGYTAPARKLTHE